MRKSERSFDIDFTKRQTYNAPGGYSDEIIDPMRTPDQVQIVPIEGGYAKAYILEDGNELYLAVQYYNEEMEPVWKDRCKNPVRLCSRAQILDVEISNAPLCSSFRQSKMRTLRGTRKAGCPRIEVDTLSTRQALLAM
jgi:hypothetical protein